MASIYGRDCNETLAVILFLLFWQRMHKKNLYFKRYVMSDFKEHI